MDLIDRQAAIDNLQDMYHAAEKWGKEASDDVIKARAESCMASLIEMKLRIEKLPSAEPEIIRCKDCKHWSDKNGGLCDIWDHYISNEEIFCGCGERRKADEDDQ